MRRHLWSLATVLMAGCVATDPSPQMAPFQPFTISDAAGTISCDGFFDRHQSAGDRLGSLNCNDGRTGRITVRTTEGGQPTTATASLNDGTTPRARFQPLIGDRAIGIWEDIAPFRAAPSRAVPTTPSIAARQTYSRRYYTGPRGGCYYLTGSGRKQYVDRSYCR